MRRRGGRRGKTREKKEEALREDEKGEDAEGRRGREGDVGVRKEKGRREDEDVIRGGDK